MYLWPIQVLSQLRFIMVRNSFPLLIVSHLREFLRFLSGFPQKIYPLTLTKKSLLPFLLFNKKEEFRSMLRNKKLVSDQFQDNDMRRTWLDFGTLEGKTIDLKGKLFFSFLWAKQQKVSMNVVQGIL